MTISSEGRQRVDAYLEKLRRGLSGIGDAEARDIVEELRSHILEKAGGSEDITAATVAPVLQALGDPEELARQYRTESLLAQGANRRSPVLLLRGLLHWASLSVGGVFVLLGSVVGYFVGGSFLLGAILKPIHPHTAGLWTFPGNPDTYSLALGFGSHPPAGGRELLGWWLVPIGLLIGGGLCLLTTYFLLWCARRYRRPVGPSRFSE